MPGIIVTGHGRFATGLISGIELILGPQENLLAVDFPAGDTAAQITASLTEAVDSFGEGPVVVFSDLRGGQPFNVASGLCASHPNLRVVFGTNLPVLIEALTRLGGNAIQVPDDVVLTEVVRAGAESVGRFEPGGTAPPVEDAGDWD